jgi:hypothetical protein
MQFLKNIQFTCLIKCDGKQREFNFRKRTAIALPYYNVDTVDLKGVRFRFNMDQSGSHWTIRERDLPAWILEAESNLSKNLLENDGKE